MAATGMLYLSRRSIITCTLLVLFYSSYWQLQSAFSQDCTFPVLFPPVDYTPIVLRRRPAKQENASVSPSPSIGLAFTQSYGFFNDITDESWERMQDRARNMVQYEHESWPEKGYENPIQWYLNNLQPDFTCPHISRVGGHGDGPKWTCDPHRLLDRENCLIYSIGSEGKYEWEDALYEQLGGPHCEIHVFDPGNYGRTGDMEHKNIHFHSWGLKSNYDQAYNAMITLDALEGAKPRMLTFQETVEELGHRGRTLDIFKIDCEKCEWANYKDWISADIRQILIETHGVPSPKGGNEWHHAPLKVADFFDAFTENNFAMYSKEVNIYGGGNCIELSYVKLHPAFWKGKKLTRTQTRDALSTTKRDWREMQPLFISEDLLPDIVVPEAAATSFKIPHRLVFAFESNVLETEAPVEYFLNIQRTIDRYREAWGEPKAPAWFLNHVTCLGAIKNAHAELLPIFKAETLASKKIDMCRMAAMYLSGGFFFGIDFQAGKPYNPNDGIRLLVARDGNEISHQFIAAEQKSPVIKRTMEKMVELSRRNETSVDSMLWKEALTNILRDPSSSIGVSSIALSDVGKDMPTAWIAEEPTIQSFSNPVPLNMRDPSPGYKIPRRLLFTFKDSLLETKEPHLLYTNVRSTIAKYREAWGEPDAPVWFLNDTDCRAAIYATRPRLLMYFDREVHGPWKADICRVAALYLTGGYYFDVDMETVNPWMASSKVTFATVMDPSRVRYFQSFLASERRGRMMDEALNEMLAFYENRKTRLGALLGPDTLKWAVESVPHSERGQMVILEETAFHLNESESALRREAVGCCCGNLVRLPTTKQTIFYSRIVGGGKSCMVRDSLEGQEYVNEEQQNQLENLQKLQKDIQEVLQILEGIERKGVSNSVREHTENVAARHTLG